MTTVRLVKAYRGYRAGEVVRLPDGLAARLRESGFAVTESQTELVPAAAERAVSGAGRETRTIGGER